MDWTGLLKKEIENTYTVTARLMDRVERKNLTWKPASGRNWMTVGQLLMHISDACGAPCKGFVTGDWGLPPGKKIEDISPEEMLPPAEAMPSVDSVEQAKKRLLEDKALALLMVERAGEADLAQKKTAPPWAPGKESPLGWHLLKMVQHLDRHSAQLFYYLKLQEKPVSTVDLWGEP